MARGRRGKRGSGAGGAYEAVGDEGELPERMCALAGCGAKAGARSAFCGYHQRTAVGAAGARELRELTREMERLARIGDGEAKGHAVAKFRARVEQGDFAILFSRMMRASMEAEAEDAELNLELGALRIALVRAMQEIDDAREMSMRVAELVNAAVRVTTARTKLRKGR